MLPVLPAAAAALLGSLLMVIAGAPAAYAWELNTLSFSRWTPLGPT